MSIDDLLVDLEDFDLYFIYGDYLEERGDQLAEGIRWLARSRRYPLFYSDNRPECVWGNRTRWYGKWLAWELPDEVYSLLGDHSEMENSFYHYYKNFRSAVQDLCSALDKIRAGRLEGLDDLWACPV